MSQKTITIILVLIVVGGLAWYINKVYLTKEQESANKGFIARNDTNKAITKPALVYVTRKTAFDIWSWQDGKSKKIFTDADEQDKILISSNIVSGKILVIVNQNPNASNGKLVEIDLTNQTKKTLQENISVPRILVYSSDLKKIASIKFSNLEENYGYTLYIENIDGENRQKIYNSSSEIKSPSWNKDSTKIAFSDLSGTTSIAKIADIANGQIADLISFENKLIDSLFWPIDNNIVLSERDIGAKSGIIKIVNSETKEIKNILNYEGGIANFLSVDDEPQNLGYLIGQSSAPNNESDIKITGQIYFYDLTSQKKQSVEKGNQILGWLR